MNRPTYCSGSLFRRLTCGVQWGPPRAISLNLNQASTANEVGRVDWCVKIPVGTRCVCLRPFKFLGVFCRHMLWIKKGHLKTLTAKRKTKAAVCPGVYFLSQTQCLVLFRGFTTLSLLDSHGSKWKIGKPRRHHQNC